MKAIESRYPLNVTGSDLDRAYLSTLLDKAAFPNFLEDLVYTILPLPEIAEAARITVDVLVDSALGLDSLSPLEDYAVRSALGFVSLDPVDAKPLYASTLNDSRFDEVDWVDTLKSLVKANKKKPLANHPAYSLLAPYLTMKAADVPCGVYIAITEWIDYVSMVVRKNTRSKPLKTREVRKIA